MTPSYTYDHGRITLTFPACAEIFATSVAAERWLEDRGFSVGRRQASAPRGILFGDVDIQKWRNLSAADIEALHGEMTGEGRQGPITITIFDTAPVAAREAFAAAPMSDVIDLSDAGDVEDVNAPYDAPPISREEYKGRLALAIGRERDWQRRVGLEVHRDVFEFVSDESWPRWWAWHAKDLDERGLPPAPPAPQVDRTSLCLTDAQLAARLSWPLDRIEACDGIEASDGVWYREGADLWRFFAKCDDFIEHLRAAE